MTKSITKRWLLNGLGIILLLIIFLDSAFIMLIKTWYKNQIESELTAQTRILSSQFDLLYSNSKGSFEQSCKEFVENYKDKERVELMLLNKNGDVLLTSSGFSIVLEEKYYDFTQAMSNDEGFYIWDNKLQSGENVVSATKTIYSNNKVIGAIRLVSSMNPLKSRMLTIYFLTLIVSLIIIFFVVASGLFFTKSIVKPVKQINDIAKIISHGDFNIRLEKTYDDEIGQLCDTINTMAQELASSEQMKNDFISSVSHELRTPLTAITGWAETMQLVDIKEDKATYDRGLDIIRKEGERLTSLVEELLDFSRLQSGRITLIMEKIDLLAEIEDAVYIIKQRAYNDDITIKYDDPELFLPVVGDKNRLRQVFMNVIENAIKYSEKNSVVEVQVVEKENFVSIIVIDNGCGIPAKDLPKVKEKFYKANKTKPGSGIGLAVADEIVSMHNGTLDIQSEENVGTTVTITFPLIAKMQGK